MISLPQNLKVKPVYQIPDLDISNYTCLIIHNHVEKYYKRTTTFETTHGSFTPTTQQEILEFLSQFTCVLTYCIPGKTDSLLYLLEDKDLHHLALFNSLEYLHFTISKYQDTIYIINNNTNLKTNIINIAPYTKKYVTENLANLEVVASTLIQSRKDLGFINFTRPATEARSLILQDEAVRDELILAGFQFGLRNLDLFNAACYGGRMETSGLGTDWHYHEDMTKAHLYALMDYPGLRGCRWLGGSHTFLEISKALPHSIFKIKTHIPPNKYFFNPLPVRTSAGIKYPSGDIIGWYYLDYLSMLDKLHIPYKILDSYILIKEKGEEPAYPLRNTMKYILTCCKLFDNMYPSLEIKHLYSMIAGCTKAIYRTTNLELAEIQVAGQCFNPIIYGFVQARINTTVYLAAIETDARAIKVDAIATPQKTLNNKAFKTKDEGLTTYINPYIKTHPRDPNKTYIEALETYKDQDYILINTPSCQRLSSFIDSNVNCVSKSPNYHYPLGCEFFRRYKIKPNHGCREGPEINKMGHLLQSFFCSKPSNDRVQSDLDTISNLNMNTAIRKTL